MISVMGVCGKCGSKLFADAPQGLCSLCLFKAAVAPLLDEVVAAGDDGGSRDFAKIPSEFGDYELMEEVGRGGQGRVYRARQKSLNRTVALKIIGLGTWATEAHLKRFRREAEAAARLQHSGIVPIHEVGERDSHCYFSMDFIEGGHLDEVVRHTPISIRQAAELIAKVARTVHYAHEHGILHRDIKPGNILLDQKGEPHLADFGLARLVETESTLTRTKDLMGTPGYMAPEQAVGDNAEITRATDVYGLGAVLYQLLAGQPPFAGGTTYETIKLLLDTEPKPPRLLNPKVDRDLSTICLKCLEKDPTRRYLSALALTEDLEHWLKHEPIVARHSGIFVRGRKWVQRNPSSAVFVALLVALATSLSVLIWNDKTIAVNPKSIAVLPFENLGDNENEYLTEGMHDEVLNDLARIADLKVISRTSVMGYRPDKPRNLRQIAATLRVRYVLEGSVQRSEDQIRIRIELIDARTDTQVWAEQYEGAPTKVFSIQNEIAKTIAEQLQAKLSPSEKLKVEQAPTTDLAAFDLYLRGRYFWNKRSTQGLERSIEYFNAAIQRDPRFVLAYVGLAESNDLLVFYADRPPELFFPKAENAARMALQIDERLGQAHVPLARAQAYYRWNRDAALREFKRAIELNPNDETAHHLYAEYLIRIGLTREGMKEMWVALKLSPAALANNLDLGTAYYALRQYDQAIGQYHKTLQMEPNFGVCHAFLGMAYAAKGMHAQALAETEKAIFLVGERPILLGMLGHTLASAGRRDDASKVLEKLISRSRQDYVAPLCMALIYAGLGEKDRAMELLEKGYTEHDPWLVQFLRNYHQFDELRPDSRYAGLMQRVGVASAQK